ncbi:MAG TPA: hypothetical protein VGH29_15045 [Candidatus Binataceae bacterium]
MQAIETWAKAAGLASGFALMGYKESPLDLLVTSAVINLALAPLTAVVASRRGRSATVWAVIGLCFGMWALAATLLLMTPPKTPPPGRMPHPPHAA